MRLASFFMAILCLTAFAEDVPQREDCSYESVRFSITIPSGFIRIDNTDTDMAAIASAAVPAGNHLFGYFVEKSNILGRKGGEPPSAYPYFMLQASKAASKAEGMKGISMEAIFDNYAKMAPDRSLERNQKEVSDIVAKLNEKAQIRNKGVGISGFSAENMGVVSRSEQHLSLLLAGIVQVTHGGTVSEFNVIETTTVIDVNSRPVFLHVYDLYDGNQKSLEALLTLTESIRSGIR